VSALVITYIFYPIKDAALGPISALTAQPLCGGPAIKNKKGEG